MDGVREALSFLLRSFGHRYGGEDFVGKAEEGENSKLQH